MYERFPELVNALRQRFAFQGMKAEHKVAILANTDSYKPSVDAAYTAAITLGARPVLFIIPHAYPFKDIPPLAEEALLHADFFVDMQHLMWFYSRSSEHVRGTLRKNKALSAGAGGLPEDVDTLIANVPNQKKVERAKKAMALVDTAKKVRITTREGTDYTVARGDPTALPSYPGGNHGQVAFAPPEGTAEGIIQAVGAMRIQAPVPEKFHIREPLRIELKKGRVSKVDRGTALGGYVDDWFKSFGREDALDFAHVNLGLIPLSLSNIDNEALHYAYGGVLHGFGIRGTPVFGTPLSDIPNHLDMHMRNASYYIDDVPILLDGRFTPESGLEFSADELAS